MATKTKRKTGKTIVCPECNGSKGKTLDKAGFVFRRCHKCKGTGVIDDD